MDAGIVTEQSSTPVLLHTQLPQLNLTPIRKKLAKDHKEFSEEQLDEIEFRYLRFLMLCKNEPNIRHEPDKDVDLYWHAHILHTKQYARDCQRFFGYFLHHESNVSDDGPDDGCGAVYM